MRVSNSSTISEMISATGFTESMRPAYGQNLCSRSQGAGKAPSWHL